MSKPTADWRQEFDRNHEEARCAIDRGSLHEALAFDVAALALAREAGDGAAIDLAKIRVATVEIELGRDGSVADLREILLRSSHPESAFSAAYSLARHHDLSGDAKRATFYARQANRHARCSGRADLVARSHNQLGNLLLAQSYFGPAAREYERALELVPEAAGVVRALILENLGYCRVVLGEHSEGITAHCLALRLLRRFGAQGYLVHPHMSLCYAYLELGRCRDAVRHGAKALMLAERYHDREALKNSLFLYGEALKLAGDEAGAWDQFCRLQGHFYPAESYLPYLLLSVEVRNLVNLKA